MFTDPKYSSLMPGDNIQDLTFHPSDIDLDVKFDSGFGCSEGPSFIAWSDNWVYFCYEYDGSECIMAVPRNPRTDFIPEHY